MGRLSRYKKVKPFDLFYKGKKNPVVEELGLPPTSQDISQKATRSMREFMDRCKRVKSFQGKGQNGVMKGEKKRAIVLEAPKRKLPVVEKSPKKPDKKPAAVSSNLEGTPSSSQKQKPSPKPLDFSQLKDFVKFGEVVQEPPSLKIKPRLKNLKSQKGGLLLEKLIDPKPKASQDPFSKLSSPASVQKPHSGVRKPDIFGALKKSTKLKNLSPAELRIFEKNRSDAITQYRKLRMKQFEGIKD